MNPTRLEHAAHRLARQLGHRPYVAHVDYFHDWDDFTAAAHVTRTHTGDLHGMTARSHRPRTRCIWTNPHLTPTQTDETLTHELAHAMLPWRHGHTATWLTLHIALLATTTSASTAAHVAATAAAHYRLPHPPPATQGAPMSATTTRPTNSTGVAASVADDLTLLVTRPGGTTSCQCTVVLEAGGDRVTVHRASMARWYGVRPDAVAHVQNTTYAIDLTGRQP